MFIDAGTAYETDEYRGISRMMERMAFKVLIRIIEFIRLPRNLLKHHIFTVSSRALNLEIKEA